MRQQALKFGMMLGLMVLLAAGGSITARAQEARLDIGNLEKLASKASETVEVTLDEKLLQMASRFLSSTKPDEARVRELVENLKGVYVRVFEFDQPGEYSLNDIEFLNTQLRAPGWSKVVGVRSRKNGENVDVHLRMNGSNIVGLAIIAAQPKELTVVNIIGPIDLEKLRALEGQFGIPRLDLDGSGKGRKNE